VSGDGADPGNEDDDAARAYADGDDCAVRPVGLSVNVDAGGVHRAHVDARVRFRNGNVHVRAARSGAGKVRRP
jgi:hypothetical protein